LLKVSIVVEDLLHQWIVVVVETDEEMQLLD
jgi:hypothetical protein